MIGDGPRAPPGRPRAAQDEATPLRSGALARRTVEAVSTPSASPASAVTPTPCSRQWDEQSVPAWGTAASAAFWLAVEQPGPWGSKAFLQSRLDPQLGARLQQETSAAGGRALLIRAVGDRRHGTTGEPRRVYLSGGAHEGRPWLLQGLFVDLTVLLHLPWEQIAAGDAEAAQRVLPELSPCRTPVLLVCTNGKRDLCCAVRGREVSTYGAGQRGAAVWECTHTGGHRFAPTGVLLPSGAALGRLDGPLAVAALDAAQDGRLASGVLDDRHFRGLAHLDGPGQAADAAVRVAIGETTISALRVSRLPDEGVPTVDSPGSGLDDPASVTYSTHEVVHTDGRSWTALVSATTRPGPPVSCAGREIPSTSYDVRLGPARP